MQQFRIGHPLAMNNNSNVCDNNIGAIFSDYFCKRFTDNKRSNALQFLFMPAIASCNTKEASLCAFIVRNAFQKYIPSAKNEKQNLFTESSRIALVCFISVCSA